MLLKKKVKAGILLYALMMLAIFSLLLQFYLHRQEAESQLLQASKQEATAYIMAQMVLEEVEEEFQNLAGSKEEIAQTEKVEGGQETTEKSTSTSSQKEEKKQIDDRGAISFQEGQASYQLSGRKLLVTVELTTGNQYAYQFPVKTMSEGE